MDDDEYVVINQRMRLGDCFVPGHFPARMDDIGSGRSTAPHGARRRMRADQLAIDRAPGVSAGNLDQDGIDFRAVASRAVNDPRVSSGNLEGWWCRHVEGAVRVLREALTS